MSEKFESSKFNSWEVNKKNMLSGFEDRKNAATKDESDSNFDDRGRFDVLKRNQMSNHDERAKEEDSLENDDLSVNPRDSLEQIMKNKIAYLVDIRSEPEAIFNGKPDLTDAGKPVINIPYKLYPSMRDNPDFKNTYKKYIFNKDSTAFLLCRDGKVSEQAANEIREFHGNCYSIKNGFDGERDENQKRRGQINGWKADGLPWEEY
jgi:rhodanese-related sulfurtransferase